MAVRPARPPKKVECETRKAKTSAQKTLFEIERFGRVGFGWAGRGWNRGSRSRSEG